MFHPERLLGQLLQSGLSGGLGRSRRKRGGSMLGGLSTGTKAQIGMGLLGVAMAAYEHYTKQGQANSVIPPSPGPTPTPASTSQQGFVAPSGSVTATDATLLVQAMVAAAAADGVIDDAERAQMLRRADEAGFDAETKRFLDAELNQPKSLAAVLKSARPEIAVDLYAASCAAITLDTDSEKIYLDNLAKHLNLSAEKRAEIHRQLGID